MRVSILTTDRYLYRKIALELSEAGHTVTDGEDAERTVCDIDTKEAQPGDLTVSRRKDADVRIPSRLGEIAEALGANTPTGLSLCEGRAVMLNGAYVKLTRIEYALISLLIEKRGYVSRREILERVWKNGADEGIINVYIHYLREKLEGSGERVIISSKNEGYRIREGLLGEVTE